MNDRNAHDDFMQLGDMSDIDNRILAEAGQDDLIDRMDQQKTKDAERKSPWMSDIKNDWFLYSLLAISFLLTEMLAIYLGTAPRIETDPATGQQFIAFHTDAGHLFTTFIYMLVFPIVTELAFDNSRKKFHRRETGNFRQTWTMGLSIVVSVISWIGTGVAGAYVILSVLGSLGFMEIPKSVQTWLVWVIPVLLAFFAVMNWLYKDGSRLAKSQKMAEENAKNAELADQMRMKQIEQAGRRAIRAAAIRTYEQAVARGLLSQQEADQALAQGISLGELERRLKRDITGEGLIGDTSGLTRPILPAPAPALRPAFAPTRDDRRYSTEQLLEMWGATREQAADFLGQYTSAEQAYGDCRTNNYLPTDMTAGNFAGIYGDLLPGAALGFQPVQIPAGKRQNGRPGF